MKRIIALLCAAVLLFAVGCNATNKEKNEFPSETVSEFTPEDRAQANTGRSFVQTEDGCYYQSGEYIYFIPAGVDESFLLCGKPNCAHDDRNCNAYCGWAFGYYDGALFALSTSEDIESYNLVKMNMDGTEHTVVRKIPRANGAEFAFHHGMLLMLSNGNEASAVEEMIDALTVIDLSDYSVREPFADFFANGNRMVMSNFVGEKFYGCAGTYKTDDPHYCLMEWDIATGKSRKIADGLIPGGYATETTFYYVEPDVGFREFDFATGETKDCGAPTDDMWWALRDEEFIYLMGRPRNGGAAYTLYFLNWDYEVIDQIELTNGTYYGYVASDRIYFVDNADYEFTPITHYIDKADIGSGELTLKTFEQT